MRVSGERREGYCKPGIGNRRLELLDLVRCGGTEERNCGEGYGGTESFLSILAFTYLLVICDYSTRDFSKNRVLPVL